MKTLPSLTLLALSVLAGGAAAEDADAAKRFIDNKAWYGQVVVVIQGEGSEGDEYDRRSYSIRREAEVTFKVKIQEAGGMSAADLERLMEASKAYATPKELAAFKKAIEELRSRRTWMTLTNVRTGWYGYGGAWGPAGGMVAGTRINDGPLGPSRHVRSSAVPGW